MFKGMGGIGNLTSMLGSFQQLPEKMKELNERMKSETISASSGCGKVNITMSGTGHVEQVSIEGDFSGHDLEVAIQEATNAAGAAAKQLYAEAISQLVNDMDLKLPGLDGMLSHFTGGA
jgi:DNA-binding protein YbaB